MEGFDVPVNRKGTGSIKWDRAKGNFPRKGADSVMDRGHGFCGSEGGQGGADRQSDHGVYGYSFATADYIESVAGWFEREYGLG